MGEAARRAYVARTGSTQRLDDGLALADEAVRDCLARSDLASGLSDVENVRAQYRALRAAGS